MATIKTMEELRQLREQNKNKVRLRHSGEYEGEQIEILVGMGTCGIAAGSRDTLNALVNEITVQGLGNVRVVPVGCIGHCQEEPILMVHMPGEKEYVYGKVTKEKVPEIVNSHIVGKRPVEGMMIQVDFGRI